MAATVPCQSIPQISKFEIMSLRSKGLHSVETVDFFLPLRFYVKSMYTNSTKSK